MSYTELEHGYQGLRKTRPAFYGGEESSDLIRGVKVRIFKIWPDFVKFLHFQNIRFLICFSLNILLFFSFNNFFNINRLFYF